MVRELLGIKESCPNCCFPSCFIILIMGSLIPHFAVFMDAPDNRILEREFILIIVTKSLRGPYSVTGKFLK